MRPRWTNWRGCGRRWMRAQVDAARALVVFLKSVTGAALTALDPVDILDTSIAVGQKIAEAEREIALVAPALRDQKQTVAAAAGALKQAEQRLAALSPPQGPVDTPVIQVERDTAGEAALDITTLTAEAYWSPVYEMHLTTGDAPTVRISRRAALVQESEEMWRAVDLVFSTADPYAQPGPSEAGRKPCLSRPA